MAHDDGGSADGPLDWQEPAVRPAEVRAEVRTPGGAKVQDHSLSGDVVVVQDLVATPGPPKPRGADRTLVLKLPYANARDGCTRYHAIIHAVPCTRCGGTGAEGGVRHQCRACAGRGSEGERACRACGGTGQFAEAPCDSCDLGLVDEVETIQITVPRAAKSGDVLRHAGKGDAVRDGVAGDLLVTLEVDTIGVLVQRGDDVVLELLVTTRHLVLGGSIDVPTLDGVINVAVPRGVHDGHTVTLAGRGYVKIGGSEALAGDPYRELARGDQLVVFRVPLEALRGRLKVVLGAAIAIGGSLLASLAL